MALLREVPRDVQGLVADLLVHNLDMTESEIWAKVSGSYSNNHFSSAHFRKQLLTERYRYICEKYYSTNTWLLERCYRKGGRGSYDYRQAVYDITAVLKQLPAYHEIVNRTGPKPKCRLSMTSHSKLDLLFKDEFTKDLTVLRVKLRDAFLHRKQSSATLEAYCSAYSNIVSLVSQHGLVCNSCTLLALATLEKYYRKNVISKFKTLTNNIDYLVIRLLQVVREPLETLLLRIEPTKFDGSYSDVMEIITGLPTDGSISKFLTRMQRRFLPSYVEKTWAFDSVEGFTYELAKAGRSADEFFSAENFEYGFPNRLPCSILKVYYNTYPQLRELPIHQFVKLLNSCAYDYLRWFSEQETVEPFTLEEFLTNNCRMLITIDIPSDLFYRYVKLPSDLSFYDFYHLCCTSSNPVTSLSGIYTDFINDYRGKPISADDIFKLILRVDTIDIVRQLISFDRIAEIGYRQFLAYFFKLFDLSKRYARQPLENLKCGSYILYLYYHYLQACDYETVPPPLPFVHYKFERKGHGKRLEVRPTVAGRIVLARGAILVETITEDNYQSKENDEQVIIIDNSQVVIITAAKKEEVTIVEIERKMVSYIHRFIRGF